jgi:hypothetical protein
VIFHSLPSIGTMTFDVNNFLSAHPALVNELAGHALAHTFYSYIRRNRGGLSRRQIRKEMNRKHRWFVDNILMYNKRLHDKNRAVAVEDARSRIIARRKKLEKEALMLQRSTLQKDQDDSIKWRNAVSLREKGSEMRGRIDARRLRARSRWLSVTKSGTAG